MSRLRVPDWALLATMLPIFAVFFGLSLQLVVSGTGAQPSFYLTPAATDEACPIVSGFWAGVPDESELRVGDCLLRMGDVEMRGRGRTIAFLMDAARLGADGLARARDFSWPEHARRTVAVYRGIMKRSRFAG